MKIENNRFLSLEISADKIEFLVDFLEDEQRWLSCKELIYLTDINEHLLKKSVYKANGRIIIGELGYKAMKHASFEEIESAANWIEKQANEMLCFADKLRSIMLPEY